MRTKRSPCSRRRRCSNRHPSFPRHPGPPKSPHRMKSGEDSRRRLDRYPIMPRPSGDAAARPRRRVAGRTGGWGRIPGRLIRVQRTAARRRSRCVPVGMIRRVGIGARRIPVSSMKGVFHEFEASETFPTEPGSAGDVHRGARRAPDAHSVLLQQRPAVHQPRQHGEPDHHALDPRSLDRSPDRTNPAVLATYQNEGRFLSGQDRQGNRWTLTLTGPGKIIVTDTTPQRRGARR